MATLYEYYNTGDASENLFYGAYWRAQTFTPSTAHTITSVKLRLYRVGSPGTLTVSIKATDGSGHPTGADLCSGTTNGDTLPTGSPYEWREITLGDGYSLSASTKYAIVARLGGDSSNYIVWRRDTTSPTYAGGCMEYSNNSGGVWASTGSVDFMFEEWGWGVLLIAPSGIASAEAFGAAILAGPIIAIGIPSAEAFGTSKFVLYLTPSGIASAEAFGSALTRIITRLLIESNIHTDLNIKSHIHKHLNIESNISKALNIKSTITEK